MLDNFAVLGVQTNIGRRLEVSNEFWSHIRVKESLLAQKS